MSWCTIESDPGVFTDLIESIGVRGCQVEELYSLDPSAFASCSNVYGLIFLFKWRKDEKDDRIPFPPEECPHVFFANQVISNACATQAILSILLNIQCDQDPQAALKVDIGPELKQLRDFCVGLPPEMKGLAINNSELIRVTHNSYAPQQAFDVDRSKQTSDDDELFHFIAYVPVNGIVYELDGLQEGPFILGPVEDGNGPFAWLDVVRPALQERISRYAASEIRFNLMAVVPNKLQELAVLKAAAMTDYEVQEYELAIQAETAKRQEWNKENTRRRWNYVPFLMNMLRILAEKGELDELVTAAAAAAAAQSAQSSGAQRTAKKGDSA
eukprot:ANDGO_07565.mRNA.1 Ubiquitin carboxyl-terminal hydrolase 2